MGETTISWTNYTFNPWEGCEPISPACDNCYAARRDRRLHQGEHWTTPKRLFHDRESYWKQLDQWHAEARRAGHSKRVFVGSLMDIFELQGAGTDQDRSRTRLWERIPELPWLTFLLTTKRPEHAPALVPMHWLNEGMPKNVWLIVTVESQDFRWRIARAQQLRCPVGVSCEPLLGELQLDEALARRQVQWIIGGGESGPGARLTERYWAASLLDQAQAHGVPFHWKGWGEWAPTEEAPANAIPQQTTGRQFGSTYGRYGAGASGRQIYGREWLELPKFWTPAAEEQAA